MTTSTIHFVLFPHQPSVTQGFNSPCCHLLCQRMSIVVSLGPHESFGLHCLEPRTRWSVFETFVQVFHRPLMLSSLRLSVCFVQVGQYPLSHLEPSACLHAPWLHLQYLVVFVDGQMGIPQHQVTLGSSDITLHTENLGRYGLDADTNYKHQRVLLTSDIRSNSMGYKANNKKVIQGVSLGTCTTDCHFYWSYPWQGVRE